jgi:hypothetical protein
MTEPTNLGYGRGGQALFLVVPALVGAGLGWGLWALLDWLLGLPWIPFRGPLSLVDRIPDQVALPVLIGLGLVAGVLFGLYAVHDELSVTVDRTEVRLRRGEMGRRLPRPAVRTELVNLWVVVRAEGGKQCWRWADRPVEP